MRAANPRISHIITVMLENRSFDNVLSFLYDRDDLPKHHMPKLKEGEPAFRGIDFIDAEELKNWANIGGLLISQEPTYCARATNVPGYDPGETYYHVNRQLFGTPDGPSDPAETPSMTGFLADYAGQVATHTSHIDFETTRQIMGGYLPTDLPVLSTLAKRFAVCDEWFASVPSQTNTNRAFSLAGTSCGLVDNGFLSPEGVPHALGDDKFETRTLFNVLSDNEFSDWGIFWFEVYPPIPGNELPYTRNLFPYLEAIPDVDDHFHRFDDPIDGFLSQLHAGTLPRFSYIEPSWGGEVDYPGDSVVVMGNEMHPPTDVLPGENLIRRIYESVFAESSPIADTALLVILFDEHGGTFDHVPPGPALPPWGDSAPPPGVECQYGFNFDRYGVRTPAILVSNGIREGTVFRSASATPFDHTSLPATVLKQFLPELDKEDWGLGERIKIAPTFEHVVTGDRDLHRSGASNVLTPSSRPKVGDPVRFGDPIWLKHESGSYVSFATHQRQHFPTISDTAVTLGFHGDRGVVHVDEPVQIRTTEYLKPETMVSFGNVFPGIRNCLGAFLDKALYYDTPLDLDAERRERQSWILRSETTDDTILRFGDHVRIESNFASFAGRGITELDAALTLVANAGDLWQVVPGIPHQIAARDRIKANERVSVPPDMCKNLIVATGLADASALSTFLSSAEQVLGQGASQNSESKDTAIAIEGGGLRLLNTRGETEFRRAIEQIKMALAAMRDRDGVQSVETKTRVLIDPAKREIELEGPDLPEGCRVLFEIDALGV